ncbi:FKBP-type peptidyl-prolyl cis-trans isomerase [Streptomyces platensis]|uniref:FKBP-type peptidyl-prolyl cis-trans isomerase n=1 Tax=Streptomyces platensis TaxID=58346 RepID=UPI001F3A322A|nr:FKBP-type peptidyl-prolyl cis-trans isomerase [Streptomyces platensis]MCF3144788.1 FKBP-type peptidyl-prolyl cis-trans isomerase [Streptomyces platensis]
MRRRRIAALIAVPLLLVSAAACGNDDSSEGGSAPKVSGQADAKPKVEKGQGTPPKKLQVKVLKEGDGPAVKKGEALNANYLGQTWEGKGFDNSWDRGAPATFEIGSGKVIKGWDEGLVGQKLGSRVELVIPPDKGYGAQAQQSIPANSTLVFVVDLKKIMPSKIDGKPVAQDNGDLPKVGTNIDGKAPKITLPKGEDAPKDVESATIIKGKGATVDAKSTVRAHYTAVTWKDGKVVANTWAPGQPGAQDVPVAQLPGWKEGLKGKKAGSRVLVVVPKSKLTPDQQKSIGSDVVFSVDVLSVN